MASDDRKAELMARIEREKVKFMRLQFPDILGAIKNDEPPRETAPAD
jgi:glutamine synthetase